MSSLGPTLAMAFARSMSAAYSMPFRATMNEDFATQAMTMEWQRFDGSYERQVVASFEDVRSGPSFNKELVRRVVVIRAHAGVPMVCDEEPANG